MSKSRKKNPSGVRIVYNKLLGGWYVVRGPHQTPLGGRFNSKAEAQAHLSRKKNPGKRKKNPGKRKKNPITVKEKIISLLQEEGYDFYTAAQEAHRVITVFRGSPEKRALFNIGRLSFTLVKK